MSDTQGDIWRKACREAEAERDLMKPVVDAAIAYEVDQETWDRLAAAVEAYKNGTERRAVAARNEATTGPVAGVVARAKIGRSTEVREILREIINMTPLDTVNVVNAAARLVIATQEACARVAEGVKDGYSANIRTSPEEQEFSKDKDGPWVLNADVAKAIRESKL